MSIAERESTFCATDGCGDSRYDHPMTHPVGRRAGPHHELVHHLLAAVSSPFGFGSGNRQLVPSIEACPDRLVAFILQVGQACCTATRDDNALPTHHHLV